MKPLLTLLAAAFLITPVDGEETDWTTAPVVQVELSSFAFTPRTIRLKAGQRVHLHLMNIATGSHNFSAPAFFQSSLVRPEDRDQIENGAVELKGFGSSDVRLIPKPGTYPLKCMHMLHSTIGMHGQIIVE